jgi:hypothetical protein
VIADNALPVWTFRANWSDPVMERLTWLTDVLASSYGTEQRRALRLSPRREFEIKFNPVDEARSYFELFLHRLGSQEFMVPLYHDAAKLADAVSPGPGTLPFDTTYREFVAGGMAIIMGADPFSCDVVAVTAVNPGGIDVTGVSKAWPKGTTVHPLRRARVDQESALTAITTHVGDATVLFQLNQANDIPDEGVWPSLFNGYPVLTDKPNRRENVDLTLARNSLILDNDHGLRELDDDAGRAFTIQTHMTMQRGRAEHWAFRQFLYRLRGQQGSIWIPTFNHDIRLSRPYTAGDAALKVKKLGYALTGGATSGRRFIHFFKEGTLGQISGAGVAPSATEESLTLSVPLAVSLAAGRIASFMDTCRLAGDQVEITHHTSTDGVAECNLAWRSFRDERTIPNPINFPIPYALKSVDPCGAPADAGCVPDDLGGPDSTGPATDGTGDPDYVFVPGPGEPGYFDYSTALACNYTTYMYGEDLIATGPHLAVPPFGDTGPSLTPTDIAEFNNRFRDLIVQGMAITRPWVNRDFPPLAAIDGAHSHNITTGINPLYNHIPTADPHDPDNMFYGVPWPINYMIGLRYEAIPIEEGGPAPGRWKNLFGLYPWDDGAESFIAANGGQYHETITYWPTHPGSPDPQVKTVAGYGCVIGCGTDPGVNNLGIWKADVINPVFGWAHPDTGQGLWYTVYFYNFVKYCPRIGLVE